MQQLVVSGIRFRVVVRWYYKHNFHPEPPPVGVVAQRYRLFYPEDYERRKWFRSARIDFDDPEKVSERTLRRQFALAGEVWQERIRPGGYPPSPDWRDRTTCPHV